ncbi:LysE/ArgO family amino acid transporter [Legionella micdadei]|uniref:L-lysine exporter family protein LysE/ArgO n=1 Tax=Legionella micdadei TaxID=451 RepID=A0A098GAE5_LEGMI|nr:LysE family transporter [Legionella micdadei]ARG96275.1 lysine transporter LysE [Legionella micdadei]ARG99030.1 lysine transporter LysE [Legionella micdadei]KTD29093.1 LysE family transporter [Legionella micdadei]NSL17302.1 LysE family transporter [Legionella micdadei]CEG59459.1 Transporter, LysE family [Legionella micdadei]
MLVYLNGLMLGLSLIMALGPQNVFLIRQGALRQHAVLSALICFCCDIILVCASVAGLHEVLRLHPVLQIWVTWFGVAFLLWYGAKALKRAFGKQSAQSTRDQDKINRLQIVMLALGFSLLNPHAIIDSLVIIGSGSTQFPDHPQAFLLGVISASFLWFSSLTFTTHYFSDVLSRVTVWRRIEFLSGLLMLGLSLKLASSQF